MKYLRTFFLAIQKEFISRANVVGWFIVGVIPSIILVLVWLTILGDRPSINGFTKGDFIVYYLFITFSWYIIGGSFVYPVGNGIKDGKINTTLLKPYNIVMGMFIQEQAWKVLSILVALPPTIFILFFFRDAIHINLSFLQIIMLIISIILGAIIFALLEAIAGLTAFWVTEVWPVAQLNEMFRSLFGGGMLPLTFLPPSILFIANILPYKYTFYVPVSILLSKSPNILIDIAMQLLYIFVLYIIYRFLWNRGIRKYEAVGA